MTSQPLRRRVASTSFRSLARSARHIADAAGRARDPWSGLEQIEPRVMLAVDHPSLPGTWVGTPAADLITLDTATAAANPVRGRPTSWTDQGSVVHAGAVTGTISAGDSGDLFKFVMPGTISSLTSLVGAAGVATATTSVAHAFKVGDKVTIAGATPSGYNGTFTIASVADTTHFTFASSTSGTATGTITAAPWDFVSAYADTITTAVASTLDSFIEVYNSAGQLITTGSNNSGASAGVVSLGLYPSVLPPGVGVRAPDGWAGFEGLAGETYFIRVKADATIDGGRTGLGTYILRMDAASTSTTVDLNPDVVIGGQTVPNVDFGRVFNENTLATLEEDITYRITVPNDNRFDSLATFQAMADDNTLLNPHIDIYSAGDNTGVVQRLGGDQDAGRQTDSFTTLLTSKAKTYYIRVRADDLRAAPTGQPLGVFQMVTRLAANNIAIDMETRLGQTGQVVTSSDDPADPWTNIPLRTSSTSMAPRAGVDAQIFKFTAQGTGLGIITVVAQQAARPATMTVLPPLPQPAMRLYDRNGAFVDFNKGNGSAQLLTSVVGNQTYYLVVEGFDNAADGGFQVFIEAHHTFDQNQPIDDHINTPANPSIPGLQLATPLRFDDPFQVLDDDGNPIRDRTWLQTAAGRGRIHDAGDTDLFQFIAPTNQLSTYPGNDGNEGAAIYVGGNFATAQIDPRTGNPYDSVNIGIFDGNAWFNAGPALEANGGINGPIFAMAQWDADGAGGAPPVLAVGGRFTMVSGLTVSNIAFRIFDANVGHYVWSADPLDPANGNPLTINGPVFSMVAGDVLPAAFQNGFVGDELYVGGQFTNAGLAVNNIVGFANIGGAIGATAVGGNGGGVTGGANPGVFAMTIMDPPQPPPYVLPAGSTLQVPPQEPDLPVQLFFGGRFTTANGAPATNGERTSVNNVARFGLNGTGATAAIEVRGLPNDFQITLGNMVPGTAVPRSWGVTATGATGGVFAMTTWDAPGQFTNNDGMVVDTPRRLILGGSFTRVVQSNNLTVTNLVGYDFSIITDVTPAPFGLRRFVNLFAAGVGNSIPNTIRALTTWHVPDTTGGVITDGMDETLAVGGDGAGANTGALNFMLAPGAAPIAFAATNGSIRTILSFKDDEIGYAPGTNADGSLAEFEAIHIGGDFTQIDGNDGFNHVARLRLDLAGPGFNWEGFREGTAGVSPGEVPGTVSSVFSLFAFDDDVATVWDRNERAASRVSIVLTKPADSRLNDATIRVFDSNFNLVYTNTTVDPTGANDVPGGNDPSLVPIIPLPGNPAWTQTNPPFPGFTVWAGEVYYVEVGGTGTGRYRFTVTTDALPPRPDPATQDALGSFPDDISGFNQPVGKGQFENAPEIQLGADGKGRPFRDPLADPNQPPSAYSVRNYRGTPAGLVRTEYSDTPVIARINDTNLFQFRAPNDGTVEFRLSTIGITRAYQEVWTDIVTGEVTSNQSLFKTINSPFHGAIRAYDNDRVQVGYSDGNAAVGGFADNFVVVQPDGANNPSNPPEDGFRVFTHNDPRLVINVRRGNVYFIEVESAFKGTFATNPDLVDWRFATGAYDLIVNATPAVTGGSSVDDFFPSFDVGGQAPVDTLSESAIPIDRLTGAGTISGLIQNIASGPFTNPNDIDTFSVVSEGRGFFTVRVTPTNPTLSPRVRVYDDTATLVTTASGGVGGVANLQFPVTQGQRFFIAVDGAGTQGTYVVDVTSPVQADDQRFSNSTPNDLSDPSTAGWANATTLQLNRFLGIYGGQTGGVGPVGARAGSIENPDDRDIYKFTAESYEIATVNVNRVDTTLDAQVLVYEINRDGAGKEVFLLIAFNDDANANTTNSQATFSVTPGRDYYVVVSGSSLNDDFGRYQVSVTVAPSDDHPNDPLLPAPTNTPDPALPTDFPNGSIINLNFDSINFTSTGTIDGSIERNTDTDLFRFTAPASGTSHITISRATGSTLALDVVVLDANNTPIAGIVFTPGVNSLTSSNFTITQGQQYYLLVRPNATVPVGSTDTGGYSISVTTDPVDDFAPTPGTLNPSGGDFSGAPLVNPAFASGVSPVNGVGTRTASLVPTGDSDLFKFATLAVGAVTVRASTPLSVLNPRVRIFDSSQTLVFDTGGNGDSSTVTFNATAAGQTYYVLVLADGAASGVNAVGSYTLTVSVALPGGGGPGGGPDDYPNAGEWADAANIGLDSRTGNGAISGVISPAADTDLFKFTVPGSGFVDIQLNTPAGGLVDGQIRIFNSAHTQVFFDSAGILGATAAVKFAATAGEQYFVLVEPVGTATGSYTLRLSTQPTTHFLYFPEGFSGSTINEFISMLNPNSFDVDFQVYARYETGQNDNVPVYTGSINANSRGGVTVSTTSNQSGALVRIGVPYSLEVRSTGPLGATFSHYDFNTAVGEAFTNRTSTTWTFAEVNKDTNNYRDFILFYNPGSVTANLSVSLYYQDGSVVTFPATIDSLRRNGINFDNDTRVTRGGKFGVKIVSDQPIVASLTSYNLPRSGGDGVLGDADGGSTQGVVGNISSGGGVTSSISFVNTNSQPATVTITADYGRTDIPKLTRVYTIPPNSQLSKNLAAVGLISGQTAGITYSSNVPVTAQATEYKFGDGDSTTTATSAARTYFMGDLFVNTATAGITYIEQLGLFNPGQVAIDIAATFLFADGSPAQTTTFHVNAGTFSFVSLDQQPIVLGHGGLVFYSLKLDSATPFVASVTHYDLFLNGGWSALGAPIGLTNPLSTLV